MNARPFARMRAAVSPTARIEAERARPRLDLWAFDDHEVCSIASKKEFGLHLSAKSGGRRGKADSSEVSRSGDDTKLYWRSAAGAHRQASGGRTMNPNTPARKFKPARTSAQTIASASRQNRAAEGLATLEASSRRRKSEITNPTRMSSRENAAARTAFRAWRTNAT